MGLFTDRPPTAAEGWAPETRNVALPGTRDETGEPRVVRIIRLPPALFYTASDEPAEGQAPFAAQLAMYRKWAEAAVIEPRFSFNGEGPPPHWDDAMPVAAQMFLANAIAAFTAEGMPEVGAIVEPFRGGNPDGRDAGGAGGGLGELGPDAPGEPAAPVAGEGPAAAGGAGA